jgi:DNA-binding Xre family transcriptional regulator
MTGSVRCVVPTTPSTETPQKVKELKSRKLKVGVIFMKLRIKELAVKKGVKLQEVAKAIGVKHNTLSNMIKRGRTTTERIEALCSYFGVSPNELIAFDDEYYEENSPPQSGESLELAKDHTTAFKGLLTRNSVSLDVKALFESIYSVPPRKQKPLIEAMQKMVEAAF